MKSINHYTIITFLILNIFIIFLIVFNIIKTQEKINQLETAHQSLNAAIAKLTDKDKLINSTIDNRITYYINHKKQQRIEKKYNKYYLANNNLETNKHIYGDENARFTLIEFSDLECSFCKKFHSIPHQIVNKSNGLVNWQWHHHPLKFHNPIATLQAQASECVSYIQGNQAFWVYLNEIFMNTKGAGKGAGDLSLLAQTIGVDNEDFTQCMNSKQFEAHIIADISLAKKLGVNSVPVTFVVDNHTGEVEKLVGLQSIQVVLDTITWLSKKHSIYE